jgi:prepilin-type N-terminal cleavage/methylation domain-containing protein
MATNAPVHGYSLVEVLLVLALAGTVAAAALPQVTAGLDEQRAAGAARFISTRLQHVRMLAIARSADVAMRITSDSRGYAFAVYVDGNRNGVRTREIDDGVDVRVEGPERLGDTFRGVEFGTFPSLPPVDPGGTPPGSDPIRLGTSNLATFTPAGTATAGSLYVRGRRTQYVVRIFGDTARTRVLRVDARTNKWKPM